MINDVNVDNDMIINDMNEYNDSYIILVSDKQMKCHTWFSFELRIIFPRF